MEEYKQKPSLGNKVRVDFNVTNSSDVTKVKVESAKA
jgi:hypothetical protein